jgi:putative transferase (TIGR04331 family)
MVEMLVPRYSYRLINFPIAGQWLRYFEEQCRFVEALPPEIREKLIVRLQSPDLGWKQKERWHDRFPEIVLDEGFRSISRILQKSRVYISTYNATTFLESMSFNIPTVIFWNPGYFELDDIAKTYFDKLKSVLIFHESPESAADHLGRVWNSIHEWWFSETVQQVRNDFCSRYSREGSIDLIFKVLKKIDNLNKLN